MLTEDNPNRLMSRHDLTVAYFKDNRIYKVVALMQHVVSIRQRFSQDDHPYRVEAERVLSWMQASKD